MKKLFFLVLFVFLIIAGWTYQTEIKNFVISLVENSKQRSAQQPGLKKYDNPAVGFSFDYPKKFHFLKDGNYASDPNQTYLHVELKNIGEKTDPMDFNIEDAMKNIQALNAGKFGLEYGFVFQPSKQVKSVGFLFAQDFLVLARFEICSVVLERKLLFYFNNKQIVITLHAHIKKLKETMPKYFTVNKGNCGDELIWDFDKQEEFYHQLLAGSASPEIQTWFDAFDQITESIIFAHR